MLAALARSKEMAVEEIRARVLERDRCMAEIAKLRVLLARAEEVAASAKDKLEEKMVRGKRD